MAKKRKGTKKAKSSKAWKDGYIKGRGFDAGRVNPQHKTPRATRSASRELDSSGANMLNRARYQDENHDITVGVLSALIDDIVGGGVQMEPMVRTRRNGEPLETANERIREAWGDGPLESTQTYPWHEQQRIAARSWLRDGEIFIRVLQAEASGYPFPPDAIPIALQYLEAEMCPLKLNRGRTRQGVTLDQWGIPQTYNFFVEPPGEIGISSGDGFRFSPFFTGGGLNQEAETFAVPAESVFHLKFARRFGQIRGLTLLHSVLFRMDDLKDYEDSERIAARIAASFAGFIRKSTDLPGVGDVDLSQGISGERELYMEAGKIFDDLLPGEDIGTMDSNRPSNRLQSFRDSMLKAFSAGTGAKYSTISRNYDGTYSAQRQELVESRFSILKMQDYFLQKFLQPVYLKWYESALLSGALVLPRNADPESAKHPSWIFPQMPWIDPLKEVQASQLAESQGYTSRTKIILDSGQNPRVVREQRMVERQLDLELGVDTDPTEKTNEQNELEGGPEQDTRLGVVNPGAEVA